MHGDRPARPVEVVHSSGQVEADGPGTAYGVSRLAEGLYTNMNAIRRDEELDNLHSCYVDQWDWEKVIAREERAVRRTLQSVVRTIFKVIKHMEHEVWYKYPQAVKHLPDEITLRDQPRELENRYPDQDAQGT